MRTIIIAVAVAAVLCTGAVAYIFASDGGSTDGEISIIDGTGAFITLDGPLTGVVTVGTNIPEAMKVLGLTDELKGMSFSATDDANNWNQYSPLFTDPVHMVNRASLSAEDVATVSYYLICPVSSATITTTLDTAFREIGGKVIRLNCYGETMLDDLEKLTALFGRTDKVMNAYNSYLNMYNGIVDTVKNKMSAAGDMSDETFLYYMNSLNAFYNQRSDGSAMIEEIYGRNALRNLNIPASGVTNAAGDDGTREVITAYDHLNPVKKVFIRGSESTSTEAAALTLWNGSVLKAKYDLDAFENDEVYVFNTNIMSGLLSFAAYVAIAEICDVSTGYSVSDLVNEYNKAYGFSKPLSGYVFQITDGKSGTPHAADIGI